MPGTDREIAALAVTDQWIHTHVWEDCTQITEDESREVQLVRDYHWRFAAEVAERKTRDRRPQRTAMRLLRSFLSVRQRGELRRLKYFYVHSPSGNSYRIDPVRGLTERVTRHGKHHFTALRFCLHDSHEIHAEIMPPADLALAHMLLLLADEDGFLAIANATNSRDQLWNRDYLRSLRERRVGA